MRNAEYWKRQHTLQAHPEGGFFREVYRSSDLLPGQLLSPPRVGERNLMTQILYLLAAPEVSLLHRLTSAEAWTFIEGDPLSLHMIDSEGRRSERVLGLNPDAGQGLTVVVERGCWFGASLDTGGAFALVTCAVVPGFDFRDFEIGKREALLALYPRHADLIIRLTRAI